MKSKLKLSYVDATCAVVRLGPDVKPPDWFWTSKFYSLTKTDEELSIVCEEESVPADLVKDTKCCEMGWGLFKVEGPLDFGLTGILNKLTTPLAKASISIFAVSTFDTDYILVKQNLAFDAGYCWVLSGHIVNGLPVRKPKDSAVTTFEKDPMVQRMIDLTNGLASAEETFGLVLVSGWVPPESVQSAYNQNFLPAVQKCFLESDWTPPSPGKIPNVYLYPSKHLHVTISTLHAFWRPVEDESKQKVLEAEWTDLVKAASKREDWPVRPLQLTLDTAQIGKKAGIMLWKDLSGGVDKMRICVQAEAQERERRLIRAGIDPGTLSIPGIIHSTFLRFHEQPESPGKDIQEQFEKTVKNNISTFFPEPITVSQVKLACERRPYMHIEEDGRHVLASFSLGGETS